MELTTVIILGFIGFSLLALTVTVLYRVRNKDDSRTPQAVPNNHTEVTTQAAEAHLYENTKEGVLAPEYEANNASGAEENSDEAARKLPQTVEEPQDSHGYITYPAVRLLNEVVSFLRERGRERQQLGKELQELDRRIKASEGHQAYTRMTALEESYFIFEGNCLNLRHLLNEFEQPPLFLELWDERYSGRLDLFVSEVTRLFHNYLAGAATLLDHTCALVEDTYQGTSFADEYQERVNQQFVQAPLSHFIEDLRDYMRHEGLPLALAELSFSRSRSGVEAKSAIQLDVSRLRDWQKWSDKGREYLDALDDEVKLDIIVDDYASIIVDSYGWLRERQSEFHRESLEELEELERQKARLQQELRHLEYYLELRHLGEEARSEVGGPGNQPGQESLRTQQDAQQRRSV